MDVFLVFLVLFVALLAYLLIRNLHESQIIENIEQKAVLITGCGAGFGKELVVKCLKNGFTVFGGCHRQASVDELKDYCKGLRGTLHAFQMNVADDSSVLAAKEFVTSKLQENNQCLYAVVNNAGVRGNHFYDDFLILDDYKDVIEVNLYGVIRVTQAFKDLIKKSRGRIVMCGSACVLFMIPGYGPYASSKAALGAYTDVIRHELRPYGVEVSLIMPGSFESNMQDTQRLLKMLDQVWERGSQMIRDEYGENYIDQARKTVQNLQSSLIAKDITWVIDSYYHAITAQKPRLLYRVGWDAWLLFRPYSLLPIRLQCYVMSLLMKIVGAPLPANIHQHA